MQREVISNCPVCESQLHVTRLHCNTCGTTIEGEFNVGRFGRLGREQFALLESFLRSRGNLRELERELGVSYPTVRNRVEAMLRTLDLADGTPMPAEPMRSEPTQAAQVDPETRRTILERLARHELTAEQAAAALRGETAAASAAPAAFEVPVYEPAEETAQEKATNEPQAADAPAEPVDPATAAAAEEETIHE